MDKYCDELSINTSFCRAHDQLLARYQKAMEAWARRREEAWHMGLRGKEFEGELGRLQNEFAGSYALLHRHRRECPLCECLRKIAQSELAQPLPDVLYPAQAK